MNQKYPRRAAQFRAGDKPCAKGLYFHARPWRCFATGRTAFRADSRAGAGRREGGGRCMRKQSIVALGLVLAASSPALAMGSTGPRSTRTSVWKACYAALLRLTSQQGRADQETAWSRDRPPAIRTNRPAGCSAPVVALLARHASPLFQQVAAKGDGLRRNRCGLREVPFENHRVFRARP